LAQKLTNDVDIKEHHRRKRYKLSIKAIAEMPHLDEPTDEQKEWVLRKLNGPTDCWKRWYD